ncbi:MAG: class I SAM-dependent methyltransferase [Bacteroidetes bacterium]|jgi:23S rRNA (cytosine1962-C5)-methyltransferase|nr:class I SAM-dependent methyltransferase [Bacteroidota bacterium]MDA0981035.1 class I SAM-dependent methyltransferase [Bacteroidota bacterium]
MGSHKIKRFVADTWKDYELLDSGEGAKLEKFGGVVLDRPEASAVWDRKKSFKEWDKAHSSFESTSKAAGYWKQNGKVPNSWNLEYKSEEHPSLRLKFNLETTQFKHIGIFPEQSCNWEYIAGKIKEGDKLLNLFAYTGGASLAAKSAGADVTHVDAIRQVIDWTRVNMELSGLTGIRWVVEDALKFLRREVKRGNKYSGVVLDPPTWGLGPKNEKWKLEHSLVEIVELVSQVVEPDGFIVMNTYSGLPPSTLETLWRRVLPNASTECGELCLKASDGHLLSTGSLIRVEL